MNIQRYAINVFVIYIYTHECTLCLYVVYVTHAKMRKFVMKRMGTSTSPTWTFSILMLLSARCIEAALVSAALGAVAFVAFGLTFTWLTDKEQRKIRELKKKCVDMYSTTSYNSGNGDRLHGKRIHTYPMHADGYDSN